MRITTNQMAMLRGIIMSTITFFVSLIMLDLGMIPWKIYTVPILAASVFFVGFIFAEPHPKFVGD